MRDYWCSDCEKPVDVNQQGRCRECGSKRVIDCAQFPEAAKVLKRKAIEEFLDAWERMQ